MNDTDQAKEVKKTILEVKKQQKLREIDDKFLINGLEGSGKHSSARGLIEIEYEKKKELVDLNQDVKDDTTQLTGAFARLALFKNSTKYRNQYRLEQLFHGLAENKIVDYFTLAKSLRVAKSKQQYDRSSLRIKKHILEIKDTFNKRSIKKWGLKLKAVRQPLTGLMLRPV